MKKVKERAFVLRLLNLKVGTLPETIASQVESLTIEALGEALLDFDGLVDLEIWLTTHGQLGTEDVGENADDS